MSTQRVAPRTPWLLAALLAAPSISGCDDSRSDAMARAADRTKGEAKEKVELPPDLPPHPMRDKLLPVLEGIYPLNTPPPVTEGAIEAPEGAKYELTPGVLAVITLQEGLTDAEKVDAIIMATAEADAWAYRPKARREYADQIHRVMRGYGDDQKELILKAYAKLRLLQYFNSEDAAGAVGKLDGSVKGQVEGIRKHYVDDKQEVWDEWMGVKMYARRVVAGDEPFRSVLRGIKKELGKEEPPPLTWEESMTTPQFKEWGKAVKDNEELLIAMLNMKDLRDREAFLTDTHSVWAMAGSDDVPAKARKLKPDTAMGFSALREDLGGGYNDMTYVFAKGLSGPALQKAYLRSIIYGQLLHDFGMLATAGSDYAQRNADNVIDATTAVVPDKYDPLYAKCGSAAAIDTFINNYSSKYPILQGLPSDPNPDNILNKAHECIIEGARGDVHIPAKDNDKDIEGPAPGSRLALFQMLARFESIDVDMARMGTDVRTEEDDKIDDIEAKLKAKRDKRKEGIGVK